jgi:hypothetical protein
MLVVSADHLKGNIHRLRVYGSRALLFVGGKITLTLRVPALAELEVLCYH